MQKTPPGYHLTAAGAAVLGNVERIEAETLAVERRITGRDVRLDASVRVTTVESLGAEIRMPVFAELRRAHPGIIIELVADSRTLSLSRREAGVAVRVARLEQNDLAVRRIGALGYGPYAAPAYLEAHDAPDFAGLGAGRAVILTEPELMGMPEMAWLATALPRAVPALRTNSRYSHRAAALAGLGLACLARYLGDRPGLVRLAAPEPMPVGELWLGVHTDTRHRPRIRAVTEAIAAGVRARAERLAPG